MLLHASQTTVQRKQGCPGNAVWKLSFQLRHFAVHSVHPRCVGFIHGIITPISIPMVTLTPMCSVHPYFPSKIWLKDCALYTVT